MSKKKYTKEARAKMRIFVDPTILTWSRRLYNAANAFLTAPYIDRMVATNIITESRATENNETQNGITSWAIVIFHDDALGANASIDKEAA